MGYGLFGEPKTPSTVTVDTLPSSTSSSSQLATNSTNFTINDRQLLHHHQHDHLLPPSTCQLLPSTPRPTSCSPSSHVLPPSLLTNYMITSWQLLSIINTVIDFLHQHDHRLHHQHHQLL